MYIKTTANRKPINNEQNSRPQRKHRLKLLEINRINIMINAIVYFRH